MDKHVCFMRKTKTISAMQPYEAMVMNTFHIQSSVTISLESLVVYGDYFGGFYPNAHVRQAGVGYGQPVKESVA